MAITRPLRLSALIVILHLVGCSSRVLLEETTNRDEHRLDAAWIDDMFQGVETQSDSVGSDPSDAGASGTRPDTSGDSGDGTSTSSANTSGVGNEVCIGDCQDAGAFNHDEPCQRGDAACPCFVERACLNGDEACSGVEVWSITVDQSEFDAMNENYRDGIRVPAKLCIDSKLYELTLEVQGASSRSLPKKNYNFRFDKHNELPGKYLGTVGTLDKLVAKAMATDRTMVRETLAFDLWRAMGHDAPYSGGIDGFIQLVINGHFNGVYSRVEPVDRDYLRRRDMRDDGQLFKGVRKNGGRADFRPGREIEDAFEDKTHPEHPDYTVLLQLLDVIQDESLSPEEFVTELGNYLSVDLIIDRMVWVSFTQNGDAVAQNFFLYYQADEQPPWHLIPWDSNLCFGADWRDPDNALSAGSGYAIGGNLLAERLLEHPQIVEAFKLRYEQLLNGIFTTNALQARMWPLMDSLLVALDRDRALWGYPTDPSTAFEDLADFFNHRPEQLKSLLERWP